MNSRESKNSSQFFDEALPELSKSEEHLKDINVNKKNKKTIIEYVIKISFNGNSKIKENDKKNKMQNKFEVSKTDLNENSKKYFENTKKYYDNNQNKESNTKNNIMQKINNTNVNYEKSNNEEIKEFSLFNGYYNNSNEERSSFYENGNSEFNFANSDDSIKCNKINEINKEQNSENFNILKEIQIQNCIEINIINNVINEEEKQKNLNFSLINKNEESINTIIFNDSYKEEIKSTNISMTNEDNNLVTSQKEFFKNYQKIKYDKLMILLCRVIEYIKFLQKNSKDSKIYLKENDNLFKMIENRLIFEDDDFIFYNAYYNWHPDPKYFEKIDNNKKNENIASSIRDLMIKTKVNMRNFGVLMNFLALIKKKYLEEVNKFIDLDFDKVEESVINFKSCANSKNIIINKNNKKNYNKNFNELILTLVIDEENINTEVYFLDNTDDDNFPENSDFVEHHHDNLKELNEKNTKLFINGKEENFKKFFTPNNTGIYEIKLVFDKNNKLKNCSYMFYNCECLVNVDFSNFNFEDIENCYKMFYNCLNIKNVDLSKFNGENLNNTEYMFYMCVNLNSVNLNGINFNKVKSLAYMFYGCIKLELIEINIKNTENIENIECMFERCLKINKINLSTLNTKNVVNMQRLFYNCFELEDINLDKTLFKTQNVTDMSFMFYNCKKIANLNLGEFNTIKVINMNSMFYNCENIKNLNLSSFNTKNVKNMSNMFYKCNNLENIIFSKFFNTINVIDMSHIFDFCSSITNLNLSSFNTQNVTDIYYK